MEQQLTPYEALIKAVEVAGSLAALARDCEVSTTAVWKWVQSAKRVSAEYVLRVEAATGVSRHLLRPDIYPRDTAPLPASAMGEETPLCGPILTARTLARNGNRRAILPGKDAA